MKNENKKVKFTFFWQWLWGNTWTENHILGKCMILSENPPCEKYTFFYSRLNLSVFMGGWEGGGLLGCLARGSRGVSVEVEKKISVYLIN